MCLYEEHVYYVWAVQSWNHTRVEAAVGWREEERESGGMHRVRMHRGMPFHPQLPLLIHIFLHERGGRVCLASLCMHETISLIHGNELLSHTDCRESLFIFSWWTIFFHSVNNYSTSHTIHRFNYLIFFLFFKFREKQLWTDKDPI